MADRTVKHAVLTAQDLRSGTVVYWQGDGWSGVLATAAVANDGEARAALETRAAHANAGNELIDAYVVDLDDSTPPRPRRYRDAWREAGPSIAFGADAA